MRVRDLREYTGGGDEWSIFRPGTVFVDNQNVPWVVVKGNEDNVFAVGLGDDACFVESPYELQGPFVEVRATLVLK